MRLLASDLAGATNGQLVGPDVLCSGATIDSRQVAGGQLFVPVVAERNGHEFVPAAVAAGAVAYFTSEPPTWGGTAVVVADTTLALADAGRRARQQLGDRVVGITGSVGKTSVKDLTAAALRAGLRVAAADKSFNNELGVPLTLLNAPDDTEVTVVEMGARGTGHIALLCSIAQPTIGVVTAVAAAHTALFGDLDGVARAKGELVESLPANGTAILNADDDRVLAMASRTTATVVTYGERGDVRAEQLVFDDDLHPRFRLISPWGSEEVQLTVSGRHMAHNALAAAAVGLTLGLSPAAVAEGLRRASLSPWRMALGRTAGGARVLNDAYNANPASMRAALDALAALPGSRKIAVLGVMAELGADSAEQHLALAGLVRSSGAELIAVGTDLYGVRPVADLVALQDELRSLGKDVAVLVKASRVGGLETLAVALAQ